MPDMTSASPLVMTHFEFISTVAAFAAVALAVILDVVRRPRSSSREQQR